VLSRGPLATVVLVVLVIASVVSVPRMLYQAAWRLASGLKHFSEEPLVARRRVFGARYADAVERIAKAIPKDGEYLLADRSHEPGQPNWIRYDLAPRRARYLGRVSGERLVVAKEGLPKSRPPFVVISVDSEQAPELIESDQFFKTTRAFEPGRSDDLIPASIDRPRSGTEVAGELVVGGWCQERGERPCSEIQILIDDEVRRPAQFERHPRPDVQAALPEMGSCERAGYRARFAMQAGETGEHRLSVYFLTADGRFRRLDVEKLRWRR
jgi:hypothetical protein